MLRAYIGRMIGCVWINGGGATPKMDCDLDTTIPDWIIEHPQVQVVFDELALDASCGGKSLRYVCHQRGLSPQAVLERLQQVVMRSRESTPYRRISSGAG